MMPITEAILTIFRVLFHPHGESRLMPLKTPLRLTLMTASKSSGDCEG
jgi:hypothetical protein